MNRLASPLASSGDKRHAELVEQPGARELAVQCGPALREDVLRATLAQGLDRPGQVDDGRHRR